MHRQVNRVPAAWLNDPNRAQLENQLRRAGLTSFPGASSRLKCLACNFAQYRVWEDRIQCLRCYHYYKIEGPEQCSFNQMKIGDLVVHPHDQAMECPNCRRHNFYVCRNKLTCIFCDIDCPFTPDLVYYWPLQPVKLWKKPVSEPRAMSRSTIYRHLRQNSQEEE